MPDPFLDADTSTTANSSSNSINRRRLTGNPLISQTDLISSYSSSSNRPIINDHGNNTPPLTADGYSNKKKKKNFTTASFRSLGCTASSQVSVPASIRSSADWEAKKMRKRNQRRNNPSFAAATTTTTIDDVWCVPAIALSASTDTAASFDRLKLDVDKKKKKKTEKKKNLRKERSSSSSSSTRRMMNQEAVIFQGSNYGFGMPHPELDEFRPRSFHHHVRSSPSPEGFSEIVMIQDRRLTGARIGGLDQFQEWRLNVDDMSYEELLELGEKIGNVNTGLKEEEMVQCLRKIKISGGGQEEEEDPTTHSSHYSCSICQEEYGEEDETGELDCGHFFHSHCIEQWLVRKNSCPICKTAAIAE